MTPLLYDNKLINYKATYSSDWESRRFLGILDHVVKCEIEEEKNSPNYSMVLEVTTLCTLADSLMVTRYIKAKPNPEDDDQFFRIVEINRDTTSGIISVKGKHISEAFLNMYTTGDISDTSYVLSFPGNKPKAIMDEIYSEYLTDTPQFTFNATDSNFSNAGKITKGASSPAMLQNVLFDTEDSFIEKFGGIFKFDNFNIYFLPNLTRGSYKPIQISYGQNLGEAKQVQTIDNLYSNIIAHCTVEYYKDSARTETSQKNYFKVFPLYWTPNYATGEGRSYLLDCTGAVDGLNIGYNNDNQSEIDDALYYAAYYFNAYNQNTLGAIKISLEVTLEAQLELMQSLVIGDQVDVVLDDGNITQQVEVVKGTYDAINERWISLTIGEPKLTLADYILGKKINVTK